MYQDCKYLLSSCRKSTFGVEFRKMPAIARDWDAKCKYQSKWYGNSLTLTIYVNANMPHFSPFRQRSRHACSIHQAKFHPRG
jgi:hypothetical protein